MRVFRVKDIANRDKIIESPTRPNNILTLSYGRVKEKNVSDNNGLLPESFDSYQILRKGEIVIRPLDLQNDTKSLRVGFNDKKDGLITSAYHVVRSRTLTPEFLYYYFHNLDEHKVFYSLGGSIRQTLKWDDLKEIELSPPDISIQNRIVGFINKKRDLIDESIRALKQKLIQLDEYKTALIHNAVTKGLDAKGCRILDGTPAAEMTWRDHASDDDSICADSEVQTHWPDIKMKYIFNRKDKKQNMSIGCGAISFGVVVYKDSDRLPLETKMAYQEVLSGEFLINPLNLNFDLKSLRTAKSELDVIVSSGYIVLQGSSEYDSEYLQWLLRVFDVVKMKTIGGGVRQTVSFSDIGKCWIAVPQQDEQEAIAEYVKKTNNTVLNSKQAINKKIALLVEYKKSLVNEAVSGRAE
jgi:restriction endonuclease S subunit